MACPKTARVIIKLSQFLKNAILKELICLRLNFHFICLIAPIEMCNSYCINIYSAQHVSNNTRGLCDNR